MENKFTQVGAGWKKDGRIVIKLNDGKWMTVFKNQRKERDNQPDFNITMATEDAEKFGLNIKYQKPYQKSKEEIDVSDVDEAIEAKEEEINPDDIPF